MLKKLLCLVCGLTMIASVAGCGKTATTSDDNNASEMDGFMSFQQGTSEAASSSSNDNVTSNPDGGIQVRVDRPDEPKQQKSVLANKNYNGKKFTILYWYTPDSVVKRKIAAFNKAHNAKLEIKIVNEDPNVAMAKSIADGRPYDIVANHGNYFPHTIFQNIYEPLESYIAKEDMYDSSKPDNGGLLSSVNDRFAWGGHYYALGSAQSVYQQLIYYNKKMFNEAGLEDPWELYKKGEWTWSKFEEMGKRVTNVANGVSFTTFGDLTGWLTLNAVSGVTLKNGTYVEDLTSSNFVNACNSFVNLYRGNEPICAQLGGDPFNSGNIYLTINTTDSYDFYAKKAQFSSAFGKKVDNLGTCPVPYGPLNTSKAYPGHAAQGYSATKGCSDPSVAACYALFESRYEDKDGTNQLPADVRKAVVEAFSKNGYIGMSGFQDSTGKTYSTVIKDISKTILEGGDVTKTLNDNRQVLQRVIADSVKSK